MKILFIEDDDDKCTKVVTFLEETFGYRDIEIARSLQSGVRAMLRSSARLILLDITMSNFDRTPNDDGGRPHPFGGREILRQMRRAQISTPVIVVTQFERFGERDNQLTLSQLKQELAERYDNYIDAVQYKTDVDEWKDHLSVLLVAFEETHRP